MSEIIVQNGAVVINNTWQKDKTARGVVELPLSAIERVTVDSSLVRIHVHGIVHPRPRLTEGDVFNKYAVAYWSEAKANEIKAQIEWQIRSLPERTIPHGWAPPEQGVKAIKAAQKHGTYEDWEREKGQHAEFMALPEEERQQRVIGDLQTKDPALAQRVEAHLELDRQRKDSEHLRPKWFEAGVAQFGDVKVNANGTVTFNGVFYSIKGAKVALDAGMANNKKFGKGRLIMGAAAAPMIGIFAAPALIRKQKGFITLEIELADGTLLSTLGPSKGSGAKDAERVVKQITKQAGPVRPTPASEPAQMPGDADDMATRIEKLATLHAQGILTDAEFAEAKSQVINGG